MTKQHVHVSVLGQGRAGLASSPLLFFLLSLTLGFGPALLLVGAGGCYKPEPLDARALLSELRASQPVGRPGAPAGSGATAERAAGAEPLGEDRSVAAALLGNHELRAFRLSRGVAEGEVISAAALANPQVRLELTHLQRGEPSQFGWDLRFSWEPPRPGVRAGRRAAAAARVDEVDKEVSEKEWALACDVRTAHATLLALDEQIQVARDTVANRRRLSEVVARRVEKGGTTRFELDLIRLSLASAEHAENERRLQRTLAAATLAQMMGGGAPAGFEVAGQLGDDEGVELPHSTQDQIEDRALANRPAIGAARARHRAAEETLRAETAARWPWFRFAAAPRIRRNEFIGATTDLVFGVEVMVPILDTNRGRVLSARSARDIARADVTTTLARMRADIARALATVDAQRNILLRLRAEIAPLLAEHDRVLTIATQAFELDLPSLIASENLVLSGRIQLINARLELRKAWIALERSVGTRVLPTPARP